MQFTIRPNIDNFAVFTHSTLDGSVIFVGADRLSEVLNIRDHEVNHGWLDRVKKSSGLVTVTIVAVFERKIDATMHAQSVRKQYANTIAVGSVRNQRAAVKRMDNGEVYISGRAAAFANGISPGAMSNHLNKRKGYDTVHGLVFEYAMDKAEIQQAIKAAYADKRKGVIANG